MPVTYQIVLPILLFYSIKKNKTAASIGNEPNDLSVVLRDVLKHVFFSLGNF